MQISAYAAARNYPLHNIAPQGVDQNKVDMALRNIRADIPLNESQLANALRNPNLSQEEKDLIVETLAKGDGADLLRFYANDASRHANDPDRTLGEDQRVIGEALQRAYENGQISADDLLRISDVNQAGNGAQRLLDTLVAGRGNGVNGSVEALSDALWARNGNNGLDRAGATLGYLSGPELTARNLNTADKRRDAFEAMVDFNDNHTVQTAGATGEIWRQSALSATGRLFVDNSAELTDHYTGANGTTAQTETLAKFLSQTVLNPQAAGVVLDRQRDLVPAIRDALDANAGRLLDAAGRAPAGSLEQERYMQQFGRLTASVSGAAALALTRYDKQIMESEASRKQFATTVATLVGATKLGKAPGARQAIEALANRYYDAITSNPERPDAALAGALYDNYAEQVNTLSSSLNQTGLSPAFEAAFAAEVTNLQQNLGVNLGGHR